MRTRAQVPSPPPTVLSEADDGGKGGRILRCTIPRKERGYVWQPTVTHHFQCGGRCGGLLLRIPAGGGTGGGQEQR